MRSCSLFFSLSTFAYLFIYSVSINSQNYGLFISEIYESRGFYDRFDAIEIYNNTSDSIYSVHRLRIRVFNYNQSLNDNPIAVRFVEGSYTGNNFLYPGQTWVILTLYFIDSLTGKPFLNDSLFNIIKQNYVLNLHPDRTSRVVGGDNSFANNGRRVIVLEYDRTPNLPWNQKQWEILDIFGRPNEVDSSHFGPFYWTTGWADGIGLQTKNINLIRKSHIQNGRTNASNNFGFYPGFPGSGDLASEWKANTLSGYLSNHLDLSSLDFPNYTLGIHTIDALPVELISFKANFENGQVKLIWSTATEINNYGFEIQRKDKESDWQKIGFIAGLGNSNSKKSYSFVDGKIERDYYEYRLKQIDFDGNYEFSRAVSINIKQNLKLELHQNYPNPFNPSTTIKFSLPTSQLVKLTIYDVLGQKIATIIDGIYEQGIHEAQFEAKDLNSGIYFYRLQTETMDITRKMILNK